MARLLFRHQQPFFLMIFVIFSGLCACLMPAIARAQLNFMATEIAEIELEHPLVFEDIDGDGRLDMLDATWHPALGRELQRYLQQADGRFAVQPRPVEIKSEVIAVGFADVRSEPGKELVLFTNSDIFTLSTAIEGYAGNLAPAARWELIADVPDPDRIQFLRELPDINGDGLADLVLPGSDVYGILRGQPDGSFQQVHEFATINSQLDPGLQPAGGGGLQTSMSINREEGIRLTVTAQRPSPFADLVAGLTAPDDGGSLLQAENWMPSAQLADMNGDGRQDIVFLNVGLDIRGQLNLLLQRDDGSFPAAPDWRGSIDTRGNIRLAEIDGDGLVDLVKLRGDGNEWDAQLYRNRGGSFDLERPDQVMRFAGYDVRLSFNDLDGDSRPELHVSFYTIPVVEAIRNTGIVRTQLLFAPETSAPESLFSRRPSSSLQETFSADNVRALAEQMSLDFDLDGDGRKEALYITEAGAIAAKRIEPGLRIADQPFWQYVPNRSVLIFWAQDLNGDGRMDLILRHLNAVTLLVATP